MGGGQRKRGCKSNSVQCPVSTFDRINIALCSRSIVDGGNEIHSEDDDINVSLD